MIAYIGFAKGLQKHPFDNKDLSIFSYAWLEGFEDVQLVFITEIPDDWNDFSRWHTGRFFGKAGEYRWRCNPNSTLHSVLLLDNTILPKQFKSVIALQPEKPDSYLILWGEWVDPEQDRHSNPNGIARFYSQKLPQIQDYPISPDLAQIKGKTPRLRVRRYQPVSNNEKKEEKINEFIRCVELVMRGREQR